ncbi:hypothetical protein C2G38_2149054 [Gigaspora rosea]|uniref:Trypsin-like cysteine/serine peptidase domain-containing protein n=1 Tax=Gigaspora rosea TaxID=44941 RepID=A0A397U6H1_9GLOM|nr:hypothetical protein C2G38_2149054 [Gigaspora rosea]
MNKKLSPILLTLLITMIVIPSIASVISQRKIVPPFVSVVTPHYNYPIGLFFIDNGSTKEVCTASVINTDNGNIGLTAAHCLFDNDRKKYNLSFLSFYPGYDNGTNGPLKDIPVVDTAIPYTHLLVPEMSDYALVRFAFRDPHGGNATLQDYTGALGWRFDIGNGEPTSVFGYPKDGDLENCANDAEHLCNWQGITEKLENFKNYYVIRNIDFGVGASGGPFISQYNTETNLGYAYAVYDGFFDGAKVSVGDIWNETTFNNLLSRITP